MFSRELESMRLLNCKAELEALGDGEHTARYILHKRQQLHDEAAMREAQAAASASSSAIAASSASSSIAAAAAAIDVPRTAVKSEPAQAPVNVCAREPGLFAHDADPFDSDVDDDDAASIHVHSSTPLFGLLRVEAESNAPAAVEEEDDGSQWFD
jgi:hypothetical protein